VSRSSKMLATFEFWLECKTNFLFSVQYSADNKQNMIFSVSLLNGAKIQISLHLRILTAIHIALNKVLGLYYGANACRWSLRGLLCCHLQLNILFLLKFQTPVQLWRQIQFSEGLTVARLHQVSCWSFVAYLNCSISTPSLSQHGFEFSNSEPQFKHLDKISIVRGYSSKTSSSVMLEFCCLFDLVWQRSFSLPTESGAGAFRRSHPDLLCLIQAIEQRRRRAAPTAAAAVVSMYVVVY
jgi:hypothetical protein